MRFHYLMGLLCFGSLLTFDQITSVSSARILVPLFMGTRSHRNAFEPLFMELAKRGHQVTIISSFKSSKDTKNLRDLSVPKAMDKQTDIMPNLFLNKLNNIDFGMFDKAIIPHFLTTCRRFYEMPEMKEILKESFDLLILNAFMNECTFGLIHHFNTTFIFISSTPVPSWISPSFGSPTVPSFNPFLLSGYSDEMSYFDRIKNFIAQARSYYARNYNYNSEMQKFYQEYFPEAPSVNELEKNVSLILANSHISVNYPRPLLADTIQVGGLNCVPSNNTLPKNLQEFLDGSGPDGFIYFSMGSFIQASTLPDFLRVQIVRTFAKLKQRVLWKWDEETMEDLPPNVMLGKWLPQQEVLSHPNIRIFITHGGILSVHEAACYGVPLIGIPIYTDQSGNLEVVRRKGTTIVLELKDLTEDTLTNSIRKLLTQPDYRANANQLSKTFRDNPMSPLDTAVYWTEYVIRHKGAVHLRSPGRDLNFLQYHSVDILLTFVGVTLAIFYVANKLLGCCIIVLFRSKTEGKRISKEAKRK